MTAVCIPHIISKDNLNIFENFVQTQVKWPNGSGCTLLACPLTDVVGKGHLEPACVNLPFMPFLLCVTGTKAEGNIGTILISIIIATIE